MYQKLTEAQNRSRLANELMTHYLRVEFLKLLEYSLSI